jgi:hypothetical protein
MSTMPNLQELLAFFQQLFQQWSELTLLNAPYAITLALTVWLVTAIGYSISLGVVKMRLAREVKARSELQASLDTTQQQLQSVEQQLAESSQQLEQANQQLEAKAQRASNLEQKLLSSNKKLAEGIAVLVEKFELIDNASAQQADADALWQRYSAIIGRVGERFQSEQQVKARLQLDVQAEKSKLADKDASIANLQGRLDSQTQRLAELEQAASEQQNLQQELETFKQRLLIAQDKHRGDSARILELEKSAGRGGVQAAATVAVEPAVRQEAPRPVVQVPTPVQYAAVVEEVSVAPVADEQAAAAVAPEVVVKQATPAKATGKLKGLFGNAMEKFSKFDEKLGSPTAPKAEVAEAVAAPAEEVIEPIAAVEPEQPVAEAPPAVVTSPAAGFANKLGGMLGSLKKAPAKPAVELVTDPEPVAVDVAEIPEAPQTNEVGKKPGKLGGLLGKFKK